MPEQPPHDAIYLKWGKFEAGIFGKPAIAALTIGALLLFAAHLLSYW